MHGSGFVEQKETESKCGFTDRSKRKSQMMDEQLQAVPDDELFGVEADYKSDEDSDYSDRDASSQSNSDDIEDDLPFVCDQCNKVFKPLP